jgi:hypothetical protein
MTRDQALEKLGRPVKIVPHGSYRHFQQGIMRSVNGEDAAIEIHHPRHGKQTVKINVRYVKRWPAGEQAEESRSHVLGAAAAVATVEGMKLVRGAGIKSDAKMRTMSDGPFAERATVSVDIPMKKNGEVVPSGIHPRRAELCPICGGDIRDGQCPEGCQPDEAPAPAGDEVEISPGVAAVVVVDVRSGRVWCGAARGFIDGVKELDRALRLANSLHPRDAQAYITKIRNYDLRPGQCYPDSLEYMTRRRATEILTDPARRFDPVPGNWKPAPYLRADQPGKAVETPPPAAPAPSPAPPPATPAPEKPAEPTPEDVEILITLKAREVREAVGHVRAAESDTARAAAALDRFRDDLAMAEQELLRCREFETKRRQAVGKLKAEMMALVERQG